MSKSFVVCDDHPLINDAVEVFFCQQKFKCLAKINSNKELIGFFSHSSADILICDLNIDHENTFENLTKIKELHPSMYIVIFSAYSDRLFIQKAKNLGLNLYISKTTELTELFSFVNFKSTSFFTNTTNLIESKKTNGEKSEDNDKIKISEQEKKIISLVLLGKTSDKIAQELYISKYTVDTHRKNINKKLNVSGIIQLQEKIKLLNLF